MAGRLVANELKYSASALVVDLGSEKGNHPVDDSQLKADKGQLPVAGEKGGYQFHVTECRDGSRFGTDLLPEKLAQLLAQSIHRETLSRREEKLHDRLGGDLPHPFSLLSNLAHGKKKSYNCSLRFSTNGEHFKTGAGQ
jgi:hypothetical protein